MEAVLTPGLNRGAIRPAASKRPHAPVVVEARGHRRCSQTHKSLRVTMIVCKAAVTQAGLAFCR
jgi:hypothetical protein